MLASADATTVYVCVTCQHAGTTDSEPRPGAILAAAATKAAEGSGVIVKPIRCLANCTRGLSAAVRCNGSWTYVFGGLDAACASALVDGARLLASAADGIMPWRGRPQSLKRGLTARVPCTIVTGFLGAGKTTLIRHVLAHANGRRLAVIVNEFSDVGIDGEILKGCGDEACPQENIV